MTDLTPEQLINKGVIANALLENPDVMGFFEEQLSDYLVAITQTDLLDHRAREHLFYSHRALSDYLDRLRAYKASADQIIESIDN